MTTKTIDKQFCTAYKRLKTDGNGRLMLKDALEKAGLENSLSNRYRLKKMTGWKEVRVKNEYGIAEMGMTISPKSIMNGWAYIQTPAVYAIINRKTKRMYIGSSKRPDLRRAVHHYWLKNYWKFGCSNVYFGNLTLKNDVEKYGIDSFYMEILKSMPDSTPEQLKAEEERILNTYQPKQLYNKAFFERYSQKVTVAFYELDKEYRELVDNNEKCKKTYDTVVLKHQKYMKQKISENRMYVEQRDAGEITNEEQKKQAARIATEYKKRVAQVNALEKQLKESEQAIRLKAKELVLKYKAATKPLY